MNTLVPVLALLTIAPPTLCIAQSSIGAHPGEIDMFVHGCFQPHEQDYASLASMVRLVLDDEFRNERWDDVPYELRWPRRTIPLLFAYPPEAPELEGYLKRATELAFWVASCFMAENYRSPEDSLAWAQRFESGEIPRTLGLTERDDLLVIDRAFRDAEGWNAPDTEFTPEMEERWKSLCGVTEAIDWPMMRELLTLARVRPFPAKEP
jgi:hypothetical protein